MFVMSPWLKAGRLCGAATCRFPCSPHPPCHQVLPKQLLRQNVMCVHLPWRPKHNDDQMTCCSVGCLSEWLLPTEQAAAAGAHTRR